MEQNKQLFQPDAQLFTGTVTEGAANVRIFLSKVFSYMATALIISGVMAYWFGTSEGLMAYLLQPDLSSGFMKPTILGYVVMFAPLALVFVMSGMVEKMSSTALFATFLAFSAIMGISFSYIFIIYSIGSIINVFFISSAVFGTMAVAGYTTKTDLTKLGSILFIGLIGIIIASVVNMFMGSSTMDYVISILGVIIFTGLTAYDMQRLKRMGETAAIGTESTNKMVLMGALSLYLDFINLFLMLLRLFGRRD